MAGHSKWANIKHRKGREDAKKGKIYTKIGREIMVAVKQGGADPETNSKLKDAISKAKSANMPNDNIQRSIKKASGDVDMANFEDIVYEGYGPSGVAIIVETLTDNRNRTAGISGISLINTAAILGRQVAYRLCLIKKVL
jgi:YebC/PmpR family DNA-binding regulatory protein